jgi:hypothetical protein
MAADAYAASLGGLDTESQAVRGKAVLRLPQVRYFLRGIMMLGPHDAWIPINDAITRRSGEPLTLSF